MENIPSNTIYSIYCITNLINQKKYIGFTSQEPSSRWNRHINGSGITISKAIQKYGKDNFKFEVILQGLNRDDVLSMETYFIETMNTLSPNGYNLTTGGEGLINPSIETRERMSLSQKKLWKSDEHKLKMLNASKNRPPVANETKIKLSILRSGKNNPFYGKMHSQETKLKSSDKLKGKIPWNKGMKTSDKTRRKQSESRIGKTWGENQRSKMSCEYTVQYENGTIENIIGMNKFCKVKNINRSTLRRYSLKNKFWKGYKIIYLHKDQSQD